MVNVSSAQNGLTEMRQSRDVNVMKRRNDGEEIGNLIREQRSERYCQSK